MSKKLRFFIILLHATGQLFAAEYGDEPSSKPKKVIVYHCIHRAGTIAGVREHGLLSHNELYKKGLASKEPGKKMMPGHHDLIYFTYMKTPPEGTTCVGKEVDPETTYVYNKEFRAYRDPVKYKQSKVKLSDYIQNLDKAEQLKKTCSYPEHVIFDPFNAIPMCAHEYHPGNPLHPKKESILSDEGGYLKHYQYYYLNEITFQADRIPPEELIFPA